MGGIIAETIRTRQKEWAGNSENVAGAEHRKELRGVRAWKRGPRTLPEELRFWASEYNIPGGLLIAAAARIEELEMDQKPSVGRAVHYVAYGTPGGEFPAGVCRAATITEVYATEYVAVCIMNPTGLFFNTGCPHDEAKAPGSWHWPERV